MFLETNIIIIGAGLTGLTTAHYLNKAGEEFIVIDKKEKVGGVINSVSESGFIYETGPNSGLISNYTVVELLEDVSGYCKVETPGDIVKKRYVLKQGKWHALPMGLVQAIKTPLFTTKDKFRILGEPFRSRGNDPHESLAELVRRRMGESFLDFAIDPFVLGVYSGDPEKLTTKYAFPKLYDLEQDYGSFIGGSVKKMFEKKGTEAKKVTKKVFSTKGGLGTLVSALYKSSGHDNYILGIDNITVNITDRGYIVNGKDQNGEEISVRSKQVITTVGAYALETLLPFIEKSYIEKISSLIYAKVIGVALGFNVWKGMKLDAFGGLIPFKEKRNILGVLFMSSLFTGRAPEQGALFSVFIGGMRRQELVSLPDNEIYEIVEKEFKELLSCHDFNPDIFKIIRHEKAIPQYGIESGERFEAIKQIEKKYKGLLIGGNLKGGIGMADRIKQGREIALSVIC